MSQLFSEFVLQAPRGPLRLANRLVVAPMCQYSATDGRAGDWHLMHWASLLNSGAGLFTIEATGVTPDGRITPACLGLWDDATETALGETLQRARRLAPPVPVCIQLSHAGRKASSAKPWDGGMLLNEAQGGWPTVAPSALPHLPDEMPPAALDMAGLQRIRQAFVDAAQRAARIGIDAIELHAAHGYLLHQFLSPLANQRTDAYGGNLEGRMRFPLEVLSAVRAVFDGVLGVRVSASDWVEGGLHPEEVAEFALRVRQAGGNFMHVSSGGVSPQQKISIGPGYQVGFARIVRERSGLPTTAVGLITQPAQAEAILQAGDADLIALARAFLYQPRWGWQAAAELQGVVQAMPAYWRGLPREAQAIFGNVRIAQR